MQEEFALTYCMKGMTWSDVQNMLTRERVWHLKRLRDQLKKENEALPKPKGRKR